MNNTTRRHPRTMNEAFGPYAHQCPIHEPKPAMDWQDRVVLAASVAAAVALAVIFAWGAV